MKKVCVILSLFLLVTALTGALLPGPVLAAGGPTLSNLRIIPTYECLGVRVAFTGTPAVDGAATLEYRPSGGTWKTAFAMYCDILGGEFRGSIFWLSPNTTYEVRVTGSNVVTGTITTRNDNPASTGNTYYVSPSGNDSNAGSQAAPWKTIGKATGAVNPGDTVILRAGTYVGGFSITRSGTASNYITIKGADGEIATLDGQNNNYNVLDVSGSYIRVKNLTFTNNKYSTGDDSALVRMLSNSDCIVEDCTMINGNGFSLVMIRNGAKNNLFQRLKWIMDKPPINSHTSGGLDITAITGGYWWKAGSGNVWRNIDIVATVTPGIWDGFGGGPEDTEGYMDDTDIYNVTVSQPPITGTWDRDDSVQPEGSDINVRVWNIQARNSFCGFANAPCLKGPLYFFRSTVADFAESMIKCGNNSYGRMYFFNNTAYTVNGGSGFKQSNSGEGNYVIRNNIIISSRFTELNTINDPTNTKSPVCKNIDLDYDFMWSTGEKFSEFYSPVDGSGSLTFAGMQAVGLETHGINQADPKFVDLANRDFHLASGSPAIDKGVVLTQFNDANSPWPYQGNAPDMGAFESAGGAPAVNPPVLNPIGNQSVTAGQAITFTLSATGSNSNALTYSASNLPSGATFNASTRTFSWTPSAAQTGTCSGVHFQVTDGTLTDSEDINITVNAVTVNQAPVLNAIGNKTVTAGQTLSFIVSATDPDANTLTYSVSNLPSGATFNSSTRAFSWTPGSSITGSYSAVHFQVSDGTLTDSEDITITVNAAPANQPPVLNAIGNKTVTAGQALSFTISATDPDNNALTYSASNLPSGAAFNASTRAFSWTPGSSITGSFAAVHFQVSDGTLTDSEDITITVNAAPANQPPVLNTIGNKTITAGQALSFTISATDPDANTLTYSASNLPAGATFNANTRAFSWTPGSSITGSFAAVHFQVSDGTLTDSEDITITVNAPTSSQAPTIAAIGNKSVNEGQALSFTVSATGAAGNTLTYSASNLPSGATFRTSTRTYSWTPSYSQAGTYPNVTFSVNDGHQSVSQVVSITVANVVRAPVMGAISNKSVIAGQALTFTVSATNPDGDTVTYAASNLPSGSTFNKSTRAFSWTPSSKQVAVYSGVRFQASCGSLTVTKDITITVTAAQGSSGGSTGGSASGNSSTFGLNSGDGEWYQGSDALCASKFLNTSGTGTLTKLEILIADTSAKGKVRIGVYADNNGKPGALLLDAGEANITNGWVSISGLNLAVTSGQSYWIVFNMDHAIHVKTQSNYGHNSFFWFNTSFGPLISQFPDGDGYNDDVFVMRATVTQ